MSKKYGILFPAFFLLSGCLCAFFIYKKPIFYYNDIILFNRIASEAAVHWNNLDDAVYEETTFPFSIISLDGAVRFHSSDNAVTSVSEALALGNPVLDISDNSGILGKVIITKNPGTELMKNKNSTIQFILFFSVILALSSACYFYYLYKKILKPFRELEQFASEIANGNLDFPVKMKKNNIFGAFTESFDLMREQILLAKEKEFRANLNQKELVASLSHDIKTPVTSIRLTSELLLELEPDEKLRIKIGMIYQKTEQIEELVSNLFHTTLQDMEQLTVNTAETYSRTLKKLIQHADYKGKVILSPIPECMILLDEVRFAQILSNILNNSYKYADTDIDASVSVSDTHLKLSFRDYGPGVPENELPLLFNKFYRGSNVSREDGSGLGLPICKKIIEQMQGEIYCTCSKENFTVTLLLKLA